MAEITDILKNLNKINIKDLLKRLDIVIFIVVIALGLLMSNQVIKWQHKKIKAIRDEIVAEEQRIILGKDLVALDNDISHIVKDYLKKDSSQTIGFFQQAASKVNVRIVSLNPDRSIEEGFTIVALFNLILEANYHNLGKFISLMESEKDIIQIESISIKSREDRTRREGSKDDGVNNLSVNMVVSATFITER